MKDAQDDKDTPTTRGSHPWVVAVGASAGGLEALQRFFSSIRTPSNAAFVVLQHLAPDHRSLMCELLAPHCALPVREAVDGQKLEVDHVYLMPAGILMTLKQDHLVFEPRPPRGISLPIDLFFRSMSENTPEQCIGVVLSGSGSDGSAGAAALHTAGGYVMAQAPETALFDSMPKGVITTTHVDAVLPPAALADQVLALTQGRAGRLESGGLVAAPTAKSALQRLFSSLLDHCGIDFGHYKLPTVMRRIERRMQEVETHSMTDYADLVEQSAEECEALRRELLIPVTSFFREPEAFDALGRILESMLQTWPEGRTLRIWSAGCATGEEAYSLVMLAMEACSRIRKWPAIKVFATDTDQNVIDVASTGIYPITAADSLTPERISQFFSATDTHLVVKPELRRQVLFARHNLLDDPPFTKMDVVVCRNTLIYLQAPAQERVMRRLQYALNTQGYLFLGSSESLGTLLTDFEVIDSARKIYRLIRPAMATFAMGSGFSRVIPATRGQRHERAEADDRARRVVELAQQQILQSFSPLSLLVTAQRQLLHAWGPTHRYLRLAEGAPKLDAIHLLPNRLSTVAGHAFHVSLHERRSVTEPPIPVDLGGESVMVRVHARLINGADLSEPCVLLSVEELENHPGMSTAVTGDAPMNESELTRLSALEQELAETRQSLQTTIEDLESANEELQATNEELMSSNEELQSTNEELQSVNEELHTVNAEYNAKLEAVSALNADLDGMSQATGIATVFVDHMLQLIRFTPEASILFRFRPSDIGRCILDFSNPLDYNQFEKDLRSVLEDGPPLEREVFSHGGTPYIVRILGYGESSGKPRRAVISLIDVSRMRDAKRLQAVLDSMTAHIAVLDVHGTIVQVNDAWAEFAQLNGGTNSRSMGVGANYLAVLARSNN
ncbi:MAG TPA: CheR family methyltransferase, partial [Aquabacterium sp.]|nr:CheR family methyltransferase [Aquabacterium sp.]